MMNELCHLISATQQGEALVPLDHSSRGNFRCNATAVDFALFALHVSIGKAGAAEEEPAAPDVPA